MLKIAEKLNFQLFYFQLVSQKATRDEDKKQDTKKPAKIAGLNYNFVYRHSLYFYLISTI